MTKTIALISLILLAFSCEKENLAYEINATIDPSANNKRVEVLRRENGTQTLIDSTTVIDGKFSLTGSVESPDVYYINIQGINGSLPIILENSNIVIEVYIDSLGASSISGSKENDLIKTYLKSRKPFRDVNDRLMSRFRLNQSTTQDASVLEEINTSYDSLKKAANKHDVKFIKDHSNSGFAAFTLERLTTGKAITKKEANELYHLLPNNIKKTRSAKAVLYFIENEVKPTTAIKDIALGRQAPNFSGLTPEGKTLSLNDVKAKVTLIDFWASWCGPCRKENPNLVKLYNKYHSRGLEIIGVSLDKENQKEPWIKAIEKDALTWPQISNLKGWQDPIALLYGVRGIPATFILEANGKLVAKNLRGPALEDKIVELLD